MINTVTGPVRPEVLGRTLVHEHVVCGLPGWETDWRAPSQSGEQQLEVAVARLGELLDAGYSTIVDPCPNDMGRDVALLRDASLASGVMIIAATGFYTERLGASTYWLVKQRYMGTAEDELADLMVAELVEGVRDTGVQAGVIKLASGDEPMTPYEQLVFAAGARASVATGARIVTHTAHVRGPEQVSFLVDHGVPAGRIVVGHCCGNPDLAYHRSLVDSGAYLGFDQFGLTKNVSDEARIVALLSVFRAGWLDRVLIAHDAIMCPLGRFRPAAELATAPTALHFQTAIVPALLAGGMSLADVDHLLIDNPRQFFAGD